MSNQKYTVVETNQTSVQQPAKPDLSNYVTNMSQQEIMGQSTIKDGENRTTLGADQPLLFNTKTIGDQNYVPVCLPSQSVFYKDYFEYIGIRPFKMGDLFRIDRAIQEKSYSQLVEAIGTTIKDFDVRDLTVADFDYILYWQRINSYIETPLKYKWTSIYGNENTIIIDSDNKLSKHIKTPELSRELYFSKFYPNRIKPETVRDAEFFSDKRDEIKKVSTQFESDIVGLVIGDTYLERRDFIESQDLSFLNRIKEFKKLSKHGVDITISVRDGKFKATPESFKLLEDRIAELEAEIIKFSDNEKLSPLIPYIADKKNQMTDELKKWSAAVKTGETYEAKWEEQTIRLEPFDFFPELG
jgi:hypothetical protein